MKKSEGNIQAPCSIALLVAMAILTSFCLVAFGFCLYFAIEYVAATLQVPTTDSAGDALSVGLSRAFSVVFLLIFAALCAVTALLGALLARAACRRSEGRVHRFSRGVLIANAAAGCLGILIAAFVYFAVRFAWI